MESKKVSLISGSYAAAQAQEMLSELINRGVQFHRLQNFINLIRYGDNCEQATANIHQLCRANETVDDLVAMAKSKNLHLQIEASLKFSFIEEPAEERIPVRCPVA